LGIRDQNGDHNWARTAPSTSDADRTASQQPEVDEHATCGDLYDWYAAIGGRVGWDDGQYAAPGDASLVECNQSFTTGC
jgi:hypothetical protein